MLFFFELFLKKFKVCSTICDNPLITLQQIKNNSIVLHTRNNYFYGLSGCVLFDVPSKKTCARHSKWTFSALALLQPSGFDFSCEKKTEGISELKANNLSTLLWNTPFSTENCGRLPQKNCQIAQRYLPCSPLSNFERKIVSDGGGIVCYNH